MRGAIGSCAQELADLDPVANWRKPTVSHAKSAGRIAGS